MKKFKFIVLGCVFMFLVFAPMPVALFFGYKAMPLVVVAFALAFALLKHLLTYHD